MPRTQRPKLYLREWIAARDLTFDQAAERSGLSKTHVVQLSSGKRRWNEGVLLKLAEGLDLATPLDLFRDPADDESAQAIFDRIAPASQAIAKRMLRGLAEPERLDYEQEKPAYEQEKPAATPRPRRRRG